MRNYLTIGPISVRISRKNLAAWGFPVVRAGGLSLLSRDTAGRLHLAAYHPRNSLTWHWFVSLYKSGGPSERFNRQWRKGYGERGVCIFGWTLSINEQAYHIDRQPLAEQPK